MKGFPLRGPTTSWYCYLATKPPCVFWLGQTTSKPPQLPRGLQLREGVDQQTSVEEGMVGGLSSHLLHPSVYCCCCLANVSLPGIGGTIPESKPFFYVNVADIESLEVEVSYVACEYGDLPSCLPVSQPLSSSQTQASCPLAPPVG